MLEKIILELVKKISSIEGRRTCRFGSKEELKDFVDFEWSWKLIVLREFM